MQNNQLKKVKLASLIITHNRILEVKAQMDIIRELWQPSVRSIDIYHEFNGNKKWYPQKYKEDFLYRNTQMSHFQGACYMLNQGIKHILSSPKKYDYIIVSSADTWFFNPNKFKNIISICQKKNYQLATSLVWGMVFGTEFFIITPNLAKRVFPLKYKKINSIKILEWSSNKIFVVESIFTIQLLKTLLKPNYIYLIPGRRTVWPHNRYLSSNFYASHHDPIQRRKDITLQINKLLGKRIVHMPTLYKFFYN